MPDDLKPDHDPIQLAETLMLREMARAKMTDEERRAEADAARLHCLKLSAEDAAGRLLLEIESPGERDIVGMIFAAKLRDGIAERPKDVEFKRCPLCNCTLEIRDAKATMRFIHHTRESCELMTLDRIRILEKRIREEVVERERFRQHGSEYRQVLLSIADQLEKVGIR